MPIDAYKLIGELRDEIHEKDCRIKELSEQLRASGKLIWPFGFTPTETKIFEMMMARSLCLRETFSSDYEDKEDARKLFNLFIHNIRKKLKDYGIKINTVRGEGYALTVQMKACVNELVAADPFSKQHAAERAKTAKDIENAAHEATAQKTRDDFQKKHEKVDPTQGMGYKPSKPFWNPHA